MTVELRSLVWSSPPPNQNSVSALALTLGRNFTEAFSVSRLLWAGASQATSTPREWSP